MSASATDSSSRPPPAIGRGGGIGVLLVNLGTPDGTDYWSLRRYLREFLSDRRVIETNPLLWWPILNLGILSVRPFVKRKDYEKIWNRVRDESPLKTITRAQAERLAPRLAPLSASIAVDWGMRYGNPSIASAIARLTAAGCDRLLVVPLYPQYSAATNASVADATFAALRPMRFQPALRIAPAYYDDAVYIEQAAASIEAEVKGLAFKPDVILASYHGMPEEYVRKGDPYYDQCVATSRLLRARLGLDEERFVLTFQSRFGRAEWLKPATDATIRALAERGVKNLAVVTPGFSADCLETLEEIAIGGAEIFRHHGGENFASLPCLNDSEQGMCVIEHLVRRELQGWA